MAQNVAVQPDDLSRFCEQHGIVRLSFFGSVLRDDLDPQRSDIDVLVEFTPQAEEALTYFRLGGIAAGLEDLLGRRVDLSLANSLDKAMRDTILSSAEVQYDAA